MKNKNMAYMMPDELEEYISSGKAIAVCGCGSVEQHGPHQLLGTDAYFTQIFMDYAAEECGGVVVPMMPFSWIGGLRQWAGTIDIRSRNQAEYLESMAVELIEMGFKCVVLMNGHGGGREATFSAARRAFKKTGVPVFAIYASSYWHDHPDAKKAWEKYGVTDSSAYEPSLAGAGMIHMGYPDAAKNLMDGAKEHLDHGGDYGETMSPPPFQKARELGDVSHFYWEERRHSKPSRQINPEAGREAMRAGAKALAAQIKDYLDYNTKGDAL